MTLSRWRDPNPDGWVILDTTSDVIHKLILEAQSCSKTPQTSAVVFDLDGTLFDVNHRTRNILHAWTQKGCPENFPHNLFQKLVAISIDDVGYSVDDTLGNLGFNPRDASLSDVRKQLNREWKRKFFDGHSLVTHDIPIKNAQKFAQSLQNSGITIVYLSGRNASQMKNGTVKQLQKHAFPMDNCKIVLKENEDVADDEFKAQAFKRLMREHHILANFENEYVNLAAMAKIAPNCHHVIMDGPHSDKLVPPLDITVFRIKQF